ncbi:putative deoxyribonuclease RhsC [compost metagenome]
MIETKANKTKHTLIRALHLTMIASSLMALGSSPLVHAQTQTSTYQYEYDAGGNLTKITDPLSRVTNQSYDALYRLTQQQQAIPATGVARPVIGYTYDGLDQLKTVTDPRSLVTTYTMDGLGNRNTLASPDTGSSNASYDAAGNLKTRTDARGKVTTFTYDALNRVTQATYGSGTPTVFQYDGGGTPAPNAIGRLTRMTDESGQTDYTYGAFGRLISQTQTVGSGAGAKTFTTSYTYGTAGSSNGKLTSMTYPGGNRIALAYDVAGRINSIVLYPAVAGVPSGTAVNLLTDIGYAPFGVPLSWTWGNSSPTASNTYARSMDLDGRITGYPLGNALNNGTNRTLTYDAAGRITAITHTGMGTGPAAPVNYNQTYAYDGLDRLTAFTSASTNQAFSYDASGNRIQATFGAGTYSNTIAANSNRLDATSGPTPAKTNTHDAAGNLTADGTISYTYNDRGRMQTALIGANTITYSYNGLGQRTKKAGPSTVIAGGANYYAYDEQGHLLGEYDADGKAIQETVFLGDIPVAVLKPAASSSSTPIMVDNSDTANVTTTGSWANSTSKPGYQGSNYQTHPAATGSADRFNWHVNVPSSGEYKVYAKWTSDANRATDVPYSIVHSSGTAVVPVNQRNNNGTWVLLGTYTFNVGSAQISLGVSNTGYSIADAVRLIAEPSSNTSSVPYYVYADHINTPRVITNSSDNQIVWRWDNSDPFGLTQPQDNPSSLGIYAYNPRFPGQVYDKETNLHYNYFRDYDPQTGRYAQSDPIGLGGGSMSTYSYVDSNPLVFYDPTGLQIAVPMTPPPPVGGGRNRDVNGGVLGYNPVTNMPTSVRPSGLSYTPFPASVCLAAPAVCAAIIVANKPPKDAEDPNGAKAPGRPGDAEGFCEPKKGPKWGKAPNGRGSGWIDNDGNVWVPTGWGSDAHGGPHWDVQGSGPNGYENVYPGGKRR